MPILPSIAVRQKGLAARALTQLYLRSVYIKAAILNYEPQEFELDNTVQIRRPQIRVAVDFDPRVAALPLTEPGYFAGDVTLEKLFGDAFPIYSSDPNKSVELYVEETGNSIAYAISRPNEEYMYSCFRAWAATTGTVRVGDHSPVGIVASVNSTGGFAKFQAETLLNAKTLHKSNDVPDDRIFAILSTAAGGAFLGDATNVNNFVSASIPGNDGGGGLLRNGMRNGEFVDRYGIMVSDSNAVLGQSAVPDLDTVAGTQATLAIASVATDTAFVQADRSGDVPIGAVRLTLTCTTALDVGVSVGLIARIGVSGAAAKAFGVILRVDTTTPTAPIITLAPYAPDGSKLVAGQIIAGTDLFSIPLIPSVSTSNHQEGLISANRPLIQPSEGSGVNQILMNDRDTGLGIQIYQGGFDIPRLRETRGAFYLTGSKISDYRKACLLLSL